MASTPAYLLSLLGRQLLLGEPAFRKRYPDSWLVWEAMDHAQPTTPELENTMTRLPKARFPERPATGDALCFVVMGANGTTLTVGRSSENAIVIGETSVSRMHCQLSKASGLWHVVRAADSMPMSLDRKPVNPGQPLALTPGNELILGNILLTFHSTASLIERLRGGGGTQSASSA